MCQHKMLRQNLKGQRRMLPLMLCLQRYDYLVNLPAAGKKPERNAAKSKKALNRVEKGIKESLN